MLQRGQGGGQGRGDGEAPRVPDAWGIRTSYGRTATVCVLSVGFNIHMNGEGPAVSIHVRSVALP